jgi:hypothetical protein
LVVGRWSLVIGHWSSRQAIETRVAEVCTQTDD